MSRTPATDWYQDDRPELWDDDHDACPMCGGDGVVGWFDHPELHGDDNAEGLEDHLVACPECERARSALAQAEGREQASGKEETDTTKERAE